MSGAQKLGIGTSAGIERLEASECWSLLQATALGRLAVVREDGTPDVFPVNYVAHEGSLYIRTARDSKLLHIAHHPVAAFEIDGGAEGVHWSVVVRGPAGRVTSDAEIRASGVETLASWSPTKKHFVIRIAAHTVTGRRFAKSSRPADSVQPFDGDAATSPSAPNEQRSRAERPQRIPHQSPHAGPV